MRFIVDIHYRPDGVEGQVLGDGADQPEPFGSWLELLRLLEAPPDEKAGTEGRGDRGEARSDGSAD